MRHSAKNYSVCSFQCKMQDNQEDNPGTSDDQTETLQDVCIIFYIVMLFICEENSDPNQTPQPVDATVVVQLTVAVAVAVGQNSV